MTQGRSRLDSSPAHVEWRGTVRWSAIVCLFPALALSRSSLRFAPRLFALTIALRSLLSGTISPALRALVALILIAASHATAPIAAILPILCHRSTPLRETTYSAP